MGAGRFNGIISSKPDLLIMFSRIIYIDWHYALSGFFGEIKNQHAMPSQTHPVLGNLKVLLCFS